MIAEGKYKVRAIEGALTQAKTGTEMVQVIVELLDGDNVGQTMRWDGFLTEKTAQRTLESLRHMGWRGDMLDDLTGITENEVFAVVEHETNDEGKTYARVKWINGRGAGIRDEARMAPAAAKSLAQRFAAMARGTRSGGGAAQAPSSAPRNGRPPAQRPPAPEGNFGDDDIPF